MDPAKKPRPDLNSLPTRQYLDQTINPILLPALKGKLKICPKNSQKILNIFFFLPQSSRKGTTGGSNFLPHRSADKIQDQD